MASRKGEEKSRTVDRKGQRSPFLVHSWYTVKLLRLAVLHDAEKIPEQDDNGHLANCRNVYRGPLFDLKAEVL